MSRATIYACVSTEMQAEDEIPILGQVKECRKFAESKEWEVVEAFKDEGYMGRNTKRPAFTRLMAEVKRKIIPNYA